MDALSEPAPADVGDRLIAGTGTRERDWREWGGLDRLAAVTLDALAPDTGRVVVVSPHPDDEVLACGGAQAMLAQAGRRILVVGVTDGEASHPGSAAWPPSLLALRRREERLRGLEALGVDGEVVALALRDGGVAAMEGRLRAALARHVVAGDTVLATWRLDGHPDHEATGRAAAAVAAACGARCLEMPVWAWHWSRPDDPRVPWPRLRRLALDADARTRKSRAIAAHGSQLRPLPAEGRPAVLPDWALARLLRPFEVFIAPEPLP